MSDIITQNNPYVYHYKLIDSTNSEARRYLEKNNVENATWFIAERQTSGRGRGDSNWVSSKGNLFCTLIHPITWDLEILPMLSCLVAVSIHETICNFVNPLNKIKIKWPNDILVNEEKISGALIENTIGANKKYTIIGIGININSSPILTEYKTSHINKYLKKDVSVNEVFLKLKDILENKLTNYSKTYIEEIRSEMLSKSWKLNEKISYKSNAIDGSGIFQGISDNYEILIKTDTDQIKLNSGELKILRK